MRIRIFLLAGTLAAALAAIATVHSLTSRVPHVVQAAPSAEPTTGGTEDEIAARDAWFFHQRAYPAEHTPPGALDNAVVQAAALDRDNTLSPVRTAPSSNLAWAKVGPQPIGTIGPDAASASGTYAGAAPLSGRVSAIAPDPGNANVAYLGGANGGVWKTTDGGLTWSPKFDAQPSLSIGAIAVDPSNTQNVWVGTGEPNSSGDSYYGAGIYKSTNGGTSWARQGGATFLEGCFVYDLAIVSSTTVVAAVAEWPGVQNPTCTPSQRGIWRTINGGTNWAQITLPGAGYQLPTDLAQPSSPKTTIYTAVYNSGVWRSIDGGATWAKLTGLSVPNYSLRGVLSVAPGAANVLYVAFAANQANNFGNLAGVWKSANANNATPGSAVFTQTVPLTLSNGPCNYPSDTYGQCSYDFDLAVDPSDTTTFFLGGIRLFKYTTSGASGGAVAYGSCATCIHVDQHVAVFGPTATPKLWVGSDGGVYNGASPYTGFTSRNGGGLSITEFNGWTSGSLGSTFIGGTQDNGTAKFTSATGLNWEMTHGGDGGASAFQSSTIFYAGYYGNDLYRTLNGGSSYSDISGAWGSDGGEFYPPLEMSPTSLTTLYRGTDRIWKGINTSTAPSWTAISPHYTAVSAIGLTKVSSNVIYAGFDAAFSGGVETAPTMIRYTTNGGGIWTAVPAAQIPDRYVTDLSVSPTSSLTAYASFSGFNAATPTKPGHIFKTVNGGSVWTNVSGNLPDVPVDSIFVDYAKNVIYAGTDIGVFWSSDGGATWGRGGPATAGLPNVPVMDIRVDGSTLVAATHGRSVYSVPAPSAIAVSGFSPASGITGSNVVISGTNLQYTKSVYFGGTKPSPSVTYNTLTKQVTAKVPDGLAVAAKISVRTGENISALSASNFTPTLSVTGFTPGSGPVGTSVTVNGIGFNASSLVKFNGVIAVTTFNSSVKLTALVPPTATTGKITVTNTLAPAGTVQSVTSFTVT
jgi:photosystem II stability/assembly factor-like uncharacterized protein